jgi:hypothetical protein
MASFGSATGRQPRGLVKINGEIVFGWTRAEVENNNFFAVDTFQVTFAANALPAAMNAAWFSQQQDMYVEVFMGVPNDPNNFGPADLTSWIYGQVDEIDYDPAEARIVVAGRDLTRVFVDTKTTQKWPNKTSSQIATMLAQQHGLTPVVTATTTYTGKFYESDHINLSDDRSEWDLLNYLATAEGFVVFVRGQSLYFQPKPSPGSTPPFQLLFKAGTPPQANFEMIRMKRALTVSRGIQVVVRSWNKLTARGVVARYPGTVKTISVGRSVVGSGVQIYSRTVPNLDQEAANRYAQNWYQQLVAHEMKIDVTMPGDNALDTTSIISLSGTGTEFDQIYYPDSIQRTLAFDTGYGMRVAAKNHSPDSTVTL